MVWIKMLPPSPKKLHCYRLLYHSTPCYVVYINNLYYKALMKVPAPVISKRTYSESTHPTTRAETLLISSWKKYDFKQLLDFHNNNNGQQIVFMSNYNKTRLCHHYCHRRKLLLSDATNTEKTRIITKFVIENICVCSCILSWHSMNILGFLKREKGEKSIKLLKCRQP